MDPNVKIIDLGTVLWENAEMIPCANEPRCQQVSQMDPHLPSLTNSCFFIFFLLIK
jgi:hypothetical protein